MSMHEYDLKKTDEGNCKITYDINNASHLFKGPLNKCDALFMVSYTQIILNDNALKC